MAVHIARGEESSAANPVLDLWIVDPATGLLAAPYALAFKVSDLSTGSLVEVQPWTPVDLLADLVQIGRYAAAWTPGAVSPAPANGRHEIRWRAQLVSGGPVREIRELFDVLEGDVAFPYPEPYALVSDLRAEGETGSDYALLEALQEASRLVERVTGRVFVPTWRSRLPVAGGDAAVLRVDDPIVAMESVERLPYAEATPELVERERYVAFNRHVTHGLTADDDRADPRVELVACGYPLGVSYRGRAYCPRPADFASGGLRYLLTGLFGYTEPDGRSFVGVTPRGVVEATKRIAVAMLQPMAGDSGSVVVSGGGGAKVVKSERTRDQSVTYEITSNSSASIQSKVGTGAIGELTGDAITDQLLARYVRQRVWSV